ncbi:hypothetical protein [Nocardia sp. XZ_19_231]|uniref:hypothetical protein n=1 Tax=Nocardia sp. XZ_19_231 TaxID=2769252 RepID=UPI00188DEE6D|nr:hypothetical protein [Nocardia sp. XZ_19_231]
MTVITRAQLELIEATLIGDAIDADLSYSPIDGSLKVCTDELSAVVSTANTIAAITGEKVDNITDELMAWSGDGSIYRFPKVIVAA